MANLNSFLTKVGEVCPTPSPFLLLLALGLLNLQLAHAQRGGIIIEPDDWRKAPEVSFESHQISSPFMEKAQRRGADLQPNRPLSLNEPQTYELRRSDGKVLFNHLSGQDACERAMETLPSGTYFLIRHSAHRPKTWTVRVP